MTLEDRIRPAVESALNELTARVDKDVRAIAQQLVVLAREDHDAAVSAALKAAREEAAADTRQQVAAAEAQGQALGRRAEETALARLVESIRGLDAATTLSDVLGALATAALSEAPRAAVLVIRQDRLLGWKLSGFGDHDAQPRVVDLSPSEAGVVGVAAQTGRPARIGDDEARAPAFANLPPDRGGLAVPVAVGGRVVAVVYADEGGEEQRDTPAAWPERLEVLARHAARCLEALTAQKTVSAVAAPRFWTKAAGTSGVTA